MNIVNRKAKRNFYIKVRALIKFLKRCLGKPVQYLSRVDIQMHKRINSTYTAEERIEQMQRFLEEIKRISPKSFSISEQDDLGWDDDNYWGDDE